jgi:NADPH:quinone reductase-like Zn-dependent oxidoreductase
VKAIVYCDYGLADRLKLEDIEKPVPEAGQILVQVRAAAANPLDWHYLRGTPYVMRLGTGLRKPAEIRLGVDYSGVVEAVGSGVTQFKPGDEVFGGRTGAFGEYVAAKSDGAVALKPANISFEQAATVPIAAITALQGMRAGGVGPGTKVLINGASGGVGTFAVQLAKALGAGHVTAVCSTRNVEQARSLGADRVLDYTREDYTRGSERYDLLVDIAGNRSWRANRRVLTPEGKRVLVGMPSGNRLIGPLGRLARFMIVRQFNKDRMLFFICKPNRPNLAFLRELIEAGKVRPVVDRVYPLSETVDALETMGEGHVQGKLVVQVT